MRNKLITIMFCLLLLAGIALHLLLPDRYYSELEKRKLEQAPKLSWTAVRSGAFGDQTERYLADQFPGRDAWVTVKTAAELLSGKRESGGVYFADDGYLMEVHRSFSGRQLAQNAKALAQLSEALELSGIRMRVMPVPTADWILRDKLPAFAPVADQDAVIAALRSAGLPVLDVSEALRAHADEEIYYRTDHHWTTLGAYYAYAAWMADLGAEAEPISAWASEILTDRFRGTTYNKVNYPLAAWDRIEARRKDTARTVDYNGGVYVTDSIYERKYLNSRDPYAVFLNSNQPRTVISGAGTGRLLILKDSYANCFAQFPLDDFEQTHLIDLRFFRGSVQQYIAENGITEVLVLYNIPNLTEDRALAGCSR